MRELDVLGMRVVYGGRHSDVDGAILVVLILYRG
jgi:hypothetical protein